MNAWSRSGGGEIHPCHGAASASAPSSTSMQRHRRGGVRGGAPTGGQPHFKVSSTATSLLMPEALARGHGDRPSSVQIRRRCSTLSSQSINKVCYHQFSLCKMVEVEENLLWIHFPPRHTYVPLKDADVVLVPSNCSTQLPLQNTGEGEEFNLSLVRCVIGGHSASHVPLQLSFACNNGCCFRSNSRKFDSVVSFSSKFQLNKGHTGLLHLPNTIKNDDNTTNLDVVDWDVLPSQFPPSSRLNP